MIHILLNHGMELLQGDEFYRAEENRWKEVYLFNDGNENIYSEKTNIPVRRLIKTHEEFEAFWQEAIG